MYLEKGTIYVFLFNVSKKKTCFFKCDFSVVILFYFFEWKIYKIMEWFYGEIDQF